MNRTITHKHLKKQFEIFEQTDDLNLLFKELEYSTLLLPVDVEDECFSVPTIDFEDKLLLPVFTDIYEYNKVNSIGNFTLVPHNFDFYLNLFDEKIDGIVIDVEGERFPIMSEYRNFLKYDEKFNDDYYSYSLDEIEQIISTVDNSKLDEFLKNQSNFWDFEELLNILSSSNVFCVCLSVDDISKDAENGIIKVDNPLPKALHSNANQSYALIYSSESEIIPKNNPLHPYCQLVNFTLFARQVLLDDLDGIILNENSQNITIPREFLFEFIDSLETVDMNLYDGFAFELGA